MPATCSTRRISITRSRAAPPYYGRVRASGRGVRIRSGASRSYYIGIESALPAVPGFRRAAQGALRRAVRDGGRDERARSPGREFGLAVGEPAEFRFLSSTVRKNDTPGALIEDWGDDLEELGPLEVTLGQRTAARATPTSCR